jgi:hypothetical protein
MPEPKSFEHVRRASRWVVVTLLFLLLGGTIAREALTYATSHDITMSGQDGYVDAMLWAASAMTMLSVIPVYISLRALFAARRTYDEGYIRLWSAITTEDMRRKAGLIPPRGRIFAPAVAPKTYSEMVYGEKETDR